MRLARLRSQMLLAMTVPACWGAQTAAPPVTTTSPPVVVVTKPVVADEFDPDRCARDTIPETVCGPRKDDANRCGAKGDSLASVEESQLHVTPYSARNQFRDFVFDLGATQGYSDRAESNGDAEEARTTCCYSRCTPIVVASNVPALVATPGYQLDEKCIPEPPGGTSAPEATRPACPAGVELDRAMRPYSSNTQPYGTSEANACCYATITPIRRVIKGRAIRIDGEPAAAPTAILAAWLAGDLAPAHVHSDEVRAQLAEAWLDAARMEHASIAAFSVLSLRLLAHGAPPELLSRTHAAALDEIEHARLAFALASAYAGVPHGPAPFTDVARAISSGDLAALAIETLLDGCWNESVAALEAEVARDCAEDPVVAAVLAKVAADEAKHAELAFAIVAWCAKQDPSIVPALRAAIVVPPCGDAGREGLEAHGVLSTTALDELRIAVLREVVAPCLDALS